MDALSQDGPVQAGFLCHKTEILWYDRWDVFGITWLYIQCWTFVKTVMNLMVSQKAGYILIRYRALRTPRILYVSHFLIFISSKSGTIVLYITLPAHKYSYLHLLS
jgi:hypothetical protein